MSQALALIVAPILAASGLALHAGPDCASSKDCPLTGTKTACCESKASDKDCSGCDKDTHAMSDVNMTLVSADSDDTAAWPTHNTDLYANDFQGESLPVALGSETWLTDSVSTEGKVVVLDFWATWCPPCRAASPILDQLQKDNADSLAVLAISGQREEQSKVESYVEEHQVAYAHLFDADQSVYKPFESKGIPLVVVISTDGIIRWIGNPHEEDFVPAVNKTLAADPAVQARKSAQANSTMTTKIDG
jgi:thiol-disulfide isomerase/thioredoxin